MCELKRGGTIIWYVWGSDWLFMCNEKTSLCYAPFITDHHWSSLMTGCILSFISPVSLSIWQNLSLVTKALRSAHRLILDEIRGEKATSNYHPLPIFGKRFSSVMWSAGLFQSQICFISQALAICQDLWNRQRKSYFLVNSVLTHALSAHSKSFF